MIIFFCCWNPYNETMKPIHTTHTMKHTYIGNSLTLPTFGTSWTVTSNFSYMNHVHPFGLDPQWHNAKNSLVFQNSMKMKMSVVLGITQMIIGVFLKTSNAVYFRKPLVSFFFLFSFIFCFDELFSILFSSFFVCISRLPLLRIIVLKRQTTKRINMNKKKEEKEDSNSLISELFSILFSTFFVCIS